ncbi:MAG: hypothetical protein JWO47_977 [Candidatus Saccharibacteria bacterium]|nr:hypothetical protein [Candidatus Saccharibacteria bacterium]
MPNLQTHVARMWSACAQTAHNCPLATGITTQNNHRPAYISNAPVYKVPQFAGFNTPSNHRFTHEAQMLINRVKPALIPTVHMAYIENKKLNLIKYY